MKLKYVAAAALALASSSAFAEVTGNVGGVSEYMFRGISQGSGAALQGGLDYASESGFYLGTWASNIEWGVGGAEVDGYLGFSGEAGNFGYDIGAIYYWYPEADEGADPSYDPNTVEFYGSLSFSYLTLGLAYTDDYFGIGDEAFYYSLGLSFPLSDSLSLDLAAGISDGDGILETFGEDSYTDWSVALTKAVSDELSVSFSYIQTDLDDDDPKFIVGASYGFSL